MDEGTCRTTVEPLVAEMVRATIRVPEDRLFDGRSWLSDANFAQVGDKITVESVQRDEYSAEMWLVSLSWE